MINKFLNNNPIYYTTAYYTSTYDGAFISYDDFMVSYDLLMKYKQPYHVNEREYFSQIFLDIEKLLSFYTRQNTQYHHDKPFLHAMFNSIIQMFSQGFGNVRFYMAPKAIVLDILRYAICDYSQPDLLENCSLSKITLAYINYIKKNGACSGENQGKLFFGLSMALTCIDPLRLYPKCYFESKYDMLFEYDKPNS